jgi:hypothetical protein
MRRLPGCVVQLGAATSSWWGAGAMAETQHRTTSWHFKTDTQGWRRGIAKILCEASIGESVRPATTHSWHQDCPNQCTEGRGLRLHGGQLFSCAPLGYEECWH